MKKTAGIAAAAALLAALWGLPLRGCDVAELRPVRTVVVSRDGTEFTVDAGVGVLGRGDSLTRALAELEEAAPGHLFFRTAEQVVVTASAAGDLAEVVRQEAFRPGAGLYLTPEPAPDPEALGEYLASHSSNVTLIRVRGDLAEGREPRVPVIVPADGGWLVYA